METTFDYSHRDIPIYSLDECNQQSSSYQEYETVWRSIAIAPSYDQIAPAVGKDNLVSGVYSIDGNDLQGVGANRAAIFLNSDYKKSSSFQSSNVSINNSVQYDKTTEHFLNKKSPDSPHHLVPTHVRINYSCPEVLGALVFQITDFLNGMMEITFDFNENNFEWDCYLSNSTFTNFKIRIYSDIFDEGILIVECSKMSGDYVSFKRAFSSLKDLLFTNFSVQEEDSNTDNCYLSEKAMRSSLSSISYTNNSFDDVVDNKEVEKSLHSIVKMARSNYLDAQVEASSILLSVSSDDRMHAALFDNGCIQCLMLLVKQDASLTAKMNAVFALANLSETNSYHRTLVDLYVSLSKDFQKPFIFNLLDLVLDGPASTAEMRREAARIVCHISSTHAGKIASDIGADAIRVWSARVDSLKDAKLKLHAKMAKKAFALFI